MLSNNPFYVCLRLFFFCCDWVFLLFRCFPLIVHEILSVLVCNLDLFSLNLWFLTAVYYCCLYLWRYNVIVRRKENVIFQRNVKFCLFLYWITCFDDCIRICEEGAPFYVCFILCWLINVEELLHFVLLVVEILLTAYIDKQVLNGFLIQNVLLYRVFIIIINAPYQMHYTICYFVNYFLNCHASHVVCCRQIKLSFFSNFKLMSLQV